MLALLAQLHCLLFVYISSWLRRSDTLEFAATTLSISSGWHGNTARWTQAVLRFAALHNYYRFFVVSTIFNLFIITVPSLLLAFTNTRTCHPHNQDILQPANQHVVKGTINDGALYHNRFLVIVVCFIQFSSAVQKKRDGATLRVLNYPRLIGRENYRLLFSFHFSWAKKYIVCVIQFSSAAQKKHDETTLKVLNYRRLIGRRIIGCSFKCRLLFSLHFSWTKYIVCFKIISQLL